MLTVPRRSGKIDRPTDPVGKAGTGRITRLLVGQAYGFIRLRNGREVFFHRADLRDASTFNSLKVGDAVTFELIDDAVSGARAIRVKRTQRTR